MALEHNPPGAAGWPVTVALAGACLMAAAVGIGRFAYTPLLPPMQEALSWSVTQAGDMASANFLGYMVGALMAAGLSQGQTRRLWLLAGMLLSAVTTTAGVMLVSFGAWLVCRFFAGVASAFCLVLGTALVIEFLSRQTRPQLGALHFSGVGSGVMISVLVLELTRLTRASVFGQWAALGLASLGLFAVAWAILRRLPALLGAEGNALGAAATASQPMTALLKKLIAAYGVFGFGYIVTATYIVAMARRLDQMALIEPLTWIVFGVCAAPSILVWQCLAHRLGMFPTLRLAYGIEAGGVILAGFGSGYVALMVGSALLGGTFMGITALGLLAARQAAGNHQWRVIGWMTASFGLGQLLGPAVAGRLAQLTGGFAAPSLVAAILLLIGFALLRGLEES